MEEIILAAPGDEVLEVRASTAQQPGDGALAVRELRNRLLRDIHRNRRARDRIAFTGRGRRRRQEEFETAMKSLAKSTATEITRPIEDRRSRTEARTRIYAAMMTLVEAAAREREALIRRSRTETRNSIILTVAAMLSFGILAASRGWIVVII